MIDTKFIFSKVWYLYFIISQILNYVQIYVSTERVV